MIVGLDGSNEAVYTRYRRGGNLSLVLANLRALVKRKREFESATPHIMFQFLDFPWSHDDIPLARELAIQLEVDEFHVKYGCIHGRQPQNDTHRLGAVKTNPQMLARFQMLKQQRDENRQYFGCDHLYQQMTINSDGSIHPCCYPVEPRHEIGKVQDGTSDLFNLPALQEARRRFGNIDDPDMLVTEPCGNCWIVGDDEALGHKISAINFLSGVALLGRA
jgi:radical SAM protein with 4Fe4S-binding SPASM domain